MKNQGNHNNVIIPCVDLFTSYPNDFVLFFQGCSFFFYWFEWLVQKVADEENQLRKVRKTDKIGFIRAHVSLDKTAEIPFGKRVCKQGQWSRKPLL